MQTRTRRRFVHGHLTSRAKSLTLVSASPFVAHTFFLPIPFSLIATFFFSPSRSRSVLKLRSRIAHRDRRRSFFTSVQMDWQGQKLVEQLMQIMLVASAVMGFMTGYVMRSFQTMILIYAGGVVLTTLVTVPNWFFFNRHPLKWLDPSEAEKHPKPQRQQPVNSKKKPSKK